MKAPNEVSVADALHTSAARRVTAVAAAYRPYYVRYESLHDERAVGAYALELFTEHLVRCVMEKRFDDPVWIATLTERLADRFRLAMDAIDDCVTPRTQGVAPALSDAVPKPWVDFYGAVRGGQSYVSEDLAFSMMAHVGFDLPMALCSARLQSNGVSHIADYYRMNEVLGSQIAVVEQAVARRYGGGIAVFSRIVGRFARLLTNYGIRLARATAWYNAARLEDAAAREDAVGSISNSTFAFIEFARKPQERWLRVLIAVVRRLVPHFRRWPSHDASLPAEES